MRNAVRLVCSATLVAACGGTPGDQPDANTGLLSTSGLYADFGTKAIAAGYTEYVPVYPLWSDGLVKRRWVYLPPGTQVNTSNMDDWVFPIGTRFFKEFALANGTKLETRLFEKVDVDLWRFGAYVWRADGSDGDFTTAGALNVNGTTHDVPSGSQCTQCHIGSLDRILGFAAIQLTGATPVSLASLAAAGTFTAAPAPAGYALPATWTPQARAALGYLHANCGNCHNENGSARGTTNQILRLSVADLALAVDQTTVGLKTLNRQTDRFMSGTTMCRVNGNDLAHSAIYRRATMRVDTEAMPPIASKVVDPVAMAVLADWIAQVAPPGGACTASP